uniref:BZIP domain-containing protein n=1 Tax=Parastrongyloides trichosuri TaxID=131310 RepID=A0A0N5A1L3_PARTI
MLQAAYTSSNVYPMSSSLNFYNPFDSTPNSMNPYMNPPYQENIPPVMGNTMLGTQTPFSNVFQETTNFMFNDKNISKEEAEKKYRERRDRNNIAAKQSRCKRRERERNLQLRVEELEKENYKLKEEIKILKNEYYTNKSYENVTSNYYNQTSSLSSSYSGSETTVSSSSPDSMLNKSIDGNIKNDIINDGYIMSTIGNC